MSDAIYFNLDDYRQVAFELAKKIPFYVAEGIFQFGSTVYGNKKPEDVDMIVVYQSSTFFDDVQIVSGNYNVNAYHIDTFTEMLLNHKIDALECLFIPKTVYSYVSPILQRVFNSFVLNKEQLRRSISSTSSNSYAKAKKKIIVKEDFDIASSIKSLWHSFRIMQFGIQLAKNNKISNFKETNSMFLEIIHKYINSKSNWGEIHAEFKPQMNKLHSEFKLLCPLVEE